jgi:hypothetical protein
MAAFHFQLRDSNGYGKNELMTKTIVAVVIAIAAGAGIYARYLRQPNYKGAALLEAENTDPKELERRVAEQTAALNTTRQLGALVAEYQRSGKPLSKEAQILAHEVTLLSDEVVKNQLLGKPSDDKASSVLKEKQERLIAMLARRT